MCVWLALCVGVSASSLGWLWLPVAILSLISITPNSTQRERLAHVVCCGLVFVGWGNFEALSLACVPYAAVNPRTAAAMIVPAALLFGVNTPIVLVRCAVIFFGWSASFI
jgi:hypothetical protein